MKDFLEYLVKNIVDKPEAVEISENISDGGLVTLSIHVDTADMGKIIGKSGKIIKAIRDLVKILAVKENRHVNVTLLEA